MRYSRELVVAAVVAQRAFGAADSEQPRNLPKVQTIALTEVYASENDARFDFTWTVKIDIGTPPQSFDLIIDTGSPDTHVFAAGSGNPAPLYDPTKSKTFVNASQPYIFEYGGPDPTSLTNVTGYVGRDTISFGGFTSLAQTFAVATGASEAQLGPTNQGILGLSFNDAVSNFKKPVFIQQLIDEGKLLLPEFALYLQRAGDLGAPAVPNQGEALFKNGEITIGGVNPVRFKGAVTFAPVTVKAFWQIALDGISLGGEVVPGTAMDAAIDCGTDVIILPPAAAANLFSRIPGSSEIEEGVYAVPCNTTLDVGVKVAGRTFPIKVEDLSEGYLDEAGTQCVVGVIGLDAQNASSNGTYPSGKPDVIILGVPFMKNVYNIFDYSHGGRVGFAELTNNGKGPYVGPLGAVEAGHSKRQYRKRTWRQRV